MQRFVDTLFVSRKVSAVPPLPWAWRMGILSLLGAVAIALGIIGYFDYFANATRYTLQLFLWGLVGVFALVGFGLVVAELLRARHSYKLQSEELSRANTWLKQLLATAVDGIHVMDMEGRLIGCSPSFAAMLGYEMAQMHAMRITDWEVKLTPQEIKQMFSTLSTTPIQTESIFRRANGKLIDVSIKATLLEEGGERYIFASSWDVTQRKANELALRVEKERAQNYLDIVETMVLVIHPDMTIGLINRKGSEILGYSPQEAVGQNFIDLFIPARMRDELREVAHGLLAYDGVRAFENPIVNKNGQERLIAWRNTPLLNEAGFVVGILSAGEDITRRIEEERMLTLHARQAQMGEMISMIAHQWRQPLAIINAITSQMRLKAMMQEQVPSALITQLVKIEEQSTHLSQTINDYRDFFRPDKPKEHFNVASLVQHALALIDHALKNSSIRIEVDALANVMLYTFRNELLQVFIALLKNALDAFEEYETYDGEIKITIATQGNDCVIIVVDNAGGISKEVLPHLFMPYFTTKNKNIGTGLGLYMSRIIVQEHCGGTITVESQAPYTAFRLTLPYEE